MSETGWDGRTGEAGLRGLARVPCGWFTRPETGGCMVVAACAMLSPVTLHGVMAERLKALAC